MDNKKNKLIKTLNLVINSLKNDTIHYSWQTPSSCNCGIVAQAITGKNSFEISEDFKEVSNKLKEIDSEMPKTWKNGVKYFCPISGEPMLKIFKELFDNGLTKEDIVHLEYMDNPAILERSGIQTHIMEQDNIRVKDDVTVREEVVPHSNFFMRLLGYTKVIEHEEITYRYIENTKKVKTNYFTEKESLIKYLQAWVSILEEGSKGESIDDNSLVDLEHELLVAVTNEDYEKAANLRDKINVI